jgi:hypothetical protein
MNNDRLTALLDQWAAHFGYYDGRIDLNVGGDLTDFATADCKLTGHGPIWGIKSGNVQVTPATTVRKTLARGTRFLNIARHNMHIARHPDGRQLCLFFVVKIRPKFVPVTLMTVPLAFVVTAIETPDGLRLDDIHEWPAKSPAQAAEVLTDHCDWPAPVRFDPIMAFGAAS